MNSKSMVTAAIQADPTLTDDQRKKIIAGYNPASEVQDRMLTRIQFAERIQVHPGSIKRFDSQGITHPIRITARVVRYRESDVEALLKKRGA